MAAPKKSKKSKITLKDLTPRKGGVDVKGGYVKVESTMIKQRPRFLK